MIIVYPKGNVPAGSLMVTSFKPIKAFGSNYTHSTLDSFLLSHTINKPQSMVRHNKKAVVLLLYCVMIPGDASYQNKSHWSVCWGHRPLNQEYMSYAAYYVKPASIMLNKKHIDFYPQIPTCNNAYLCFLSRWLAWPHTKFFAQFSTTSMYFEREKTYIQICLHAQVVLGPLFPGTRYIQNTLYIQTFCIKIGAGKCHQVTAESLQPQSVFKGRDDQR